METDILQQEILLLTDTTFSQRQLCENDAKDDSSHLSESEKLEEACWTGLLDELLPEIIANKKLHIWQIGILNFLCKLNYQNTRQKKSSFLSILITF